jgi:hypothetical protein
VKIFIASLAIMIALSVRSYAGQIVYGFAYPDSYGNSMTGTITTDGTIGDLQLANIIGWTEQVYTGPNFLSGAAPYVPNSTLDLQVQGVLEATLTYLSLPASLTPPIGQDTQSTATISGDNYSIRFANGVLNSGPYAGNPVSVQSVNSVLTPPGGTPQPLYSWNASAPGENDFFVFATAIATPEPSSLVLAALGLAALLAYRWRR